MTTPDPRYSRSALALLEMLKDLEGVLERDRELGSHDLGAIAAALHAAKCTAYRAAQARLAAELAGSLTLRRSAPSADAPTLPRVSLVRSSGAREEG